MAADHPTTSLNYPNHAAASFRNVHFWRAARGDPYPTYETGSTSNSVLLKGLVPMLEPVA